MKPRTQTTLQLLCSFQSREIFFPSLKKTGDGPPCSHGTEHCLHCKTWLCNTSGIFGQDSWARGQKPLSNDLKRWGKILQVNLIVLDPGVLPLAFDYWQNQHKNAGSVNRREEQDFLPDTFLLAMNEKRLHIQRLLPTLIIHYLLNFSFISHPSSKEICVVYKVLFPSSYLSL